MKSIHFSSRTSLLRTLCSLTLVTALAGCASFVPAVPDNYTGPTATVQDGSAYIGATAAQLFVLRAIDGNPITTSIEASANASYGRGSRLTVVMSERKVPARPMKATLLARHVTGAPIQLMMMQAQGTYREVEGVVDFHPQPGKTYVVMATLDASGRKVWIAEAGSQTRVTAEVAAP